MYMEIALPWKQCWQMQESQQVNYWFLGICSRRETSRRNILDRMDHQPLQVRGELEDSLWHALQKRLVLQLPAISIWPALPFLSESHQEGTSAYAGTSLPNLDRSRGVELRSVISARQNLGTGVDSYWRASDFTAFWRKRLRYRYIYEYSP